MGLGLNGLILAQKQKKGLCKVKAPVGAKKKEKQSVLLVNFGWGWRVGVTLCQCIDNTHQCPGRSGNGNPFF